MSRKWSGDDLRLNELFTSMNASPGEEVGTASYTRKLLSMSTGILGCLNGGRVGRWGNY
jgi:hypothetical protein